MKPYAIGVDIGGTKTAIGIVDRAGSVVAKRVIPTETRIVPESMCERIVVTLMELLAQIPLNVQEIAGLGVGAPGPIDRERGLIVCPPNLPTWAGFPIRRFFEERIPLSFLFENDANVAALAEKWIGAAQENESFIYLTISTGIGGGLYLNGEVVWGKYGNAGEVGFAIMTPDGKTIEQLASGKAIAMRASEILQKKVTTEEVFELYSLGHPTIVPFVEETFRYLGMLCSNLIHFFEPEKIVIGGGVSRVGEPLFRAIRDFVRHHVSTPFGRKTEIVPAKLKQDTGLVGAAALFLAR